MSNKIQDLLLMAEHAVNQKQRTFTVGARVPRGTRGPKIKLLSAPGMQPLMAKIVSYGTRGNSAGLVEVRVKELVAFFDAYRIIHPPPAPASTDVAPVEPTP